MILSRVCMFSQTHAEQEEDAILGALPETLRDTTVPMCLRGFDENGLFGSEGLFCTVAIGQPAAVALHSFVVHDGVYCSNLCLFRD